MDTRDADRRLIRKLLDERAAVPFSYGKVRSVPLYDTENDRYALFAIGWDKKRIHFCLLHVDLIDGKFWVQHDATSESIAEELQAAGVPKDRIVLAFHSERDRPHTGYAVA